MSRGFVRELDEDSGALPERPISRQPNLVTPAGLAKIAAQLDALEVARRDAAQDRSALAHIERDIRYWRQRRASARVIEPPESPSVVRFGVAVSLRLEDGRERRLQIVGEDEADPAAGLISWTSPVATSLIGHVPGDCVEVFGQRATIEALALRDRSNTHTEGARPLQHVTASQVAASTVTASQLAGAHGIGSAHGG